MICPDCNGEKKVFAHVNFGELDPRNGFGWIGCSRCEGIGDVPDAQAEWISEGIRRHYDRVSRDVSLREEAQRLGIPVVSLSKMERGILPFPTLGQQDKS